MTETEAPSQHRVMHPDDGVNVGAIGLVLFLVIAGLDLNSTPPHPFNLGVWPWVLIGLGLIGLGLSFTREASLGNQPRRLAENLRGR